MNELRAKEHKLFELLEPAVERQGCELVAVEMATVDGQSTLRVSIDKLGGVSVGDCGKVSRALSPVLDVEDPIESAYRLEVSSPGIDRPLQRLVDFVRFEGFRAKIKLDDEEAGRRNYKGVLQGADPSGAVLVEVDGVEHSLPLERIERARLVLDLGEYERLASDPPPRPLIPIDPGEMS